MLLPCAVFVLEQNLMWFLWLLHRELSNCLAHLQEIQENALKLGHSLAKLSLNDTSSPV